MIEHYQHDREDKDDNVEDRLLTLRAKGGDAKE